MGEHFRHAAEVPVVGVEEIDSQPITTSVRIDYAGVNY